MDEMFDQWTVAKNPYDYHLFFREWSKIDTRDTVKRDRNHPSVVLYSAGNEIRDTPNAPLAKDILSGLVATFHEFDPSRPVTQALFRPNASHDYEDGLADLLDVIGQNYRENMKISRRARLSAPRTAMTGASGWPCAITLRMRGSSCGPGSITWASRGAGRRSARRRVCWTARGC
jgi:beta-galactosidase